MGEKALKNLAVFTFVLMLSVLMLSMVITDSLEGRGKASASEEAWTTNYEHNNKSKGYLSTANELKESLGEKYIVIENTGNTASDSLTEDYMNRKITLSIKGLKDESLTEKGIVRINQDMSYQGIPGLKEAADGEYLIPESLSANGEVSVYGAVPESLKTDPVNNLTITYKKVSDKEYEADICFTLDHVYAPVLQQEDGNIYIALKEPASVYDNIVVLDAGHGGKDPGAKTADNSSYEKSINLKILLELKELLDRENIKVYYTRTGDDTVFLNPRVNLANDVKADLFLSIHCNSSESSIPRGVEVLYKSEGQQGEFTSEKLARIALDQLKGITGYVNRGLVTGDEILIIHKSQVPVALIETGFVSNAEELGFLKSKEKEKEIAEAVVQVIKKALGEINKVKTTN
ncbi:N-acetylmuramoyl-L-alanine amidase family protein [Anaerocolumna chitinilytica]|uniref:MurNAc-LAA domain-containing protein n=1 Tax=Anaerocolumna chitinilytica TaxID=1727145 RepID=A0A7I8DK64_9FIRM|nr:N-acetylmuramoyl-L-alanine amidase [Anaerocolumna chitinilytica]BCJ97405.1 hypothetical protein bsdcttw_04460 [Anaerocolumna chitinilytica]